MDEEKIIIRASLQLKGTDICMDIKCKCDANLHVDGYSIFSIKCPSCGKSYIVNPNIELFESNEDPGGTVIAEII